MAITDRRKRRGQHYALDAGVARGAQHAERPFARGNDQLVLVLGYRLGKRRRHVQHVFAAGDGLRPTRVVFEIGGKESQTFARFGAARLQHGAHVVLALQAPNRGTHLMARGQELQDAVGADKTGAAGNQNCAHHP